MHDVSQELMTCFELLGNVARPWLNEFRIAEGEQLAEPHVTLVE